MNRNIILFYSPGSFIDEVSSVETTPDWNIDDAVERSKTITERYGAKPYAFRFQELDSDKKVVRSSNLYFISGHIETAEEVLSRDDPSEEILRSNIRNNNIAAIVTTSVGGYKTTRPLDKGDVVLKVEL